jgi:hypothetical protein
LGGLQNSPYYKGVGMKNTTTVSSPQKLKQQPRTKGSKAPKKAKIELIVPYLTDHGSFILKEYPQVAMRSSKLVKDLKDIFIGQSKVAGQVGQLLGQIHKIFQQEISPSKINGKLGTSLFYRFVSAEFNLGKSRTQEYLLLAQRDDINQLELPLSILIELARIDRTRVAKFLKTYPLKDLKHLSYRQVSQLIRKENPNSRKRKKQRKSKSNSLFNSKIENHKTAIKRLVGLKSSLRSFYAKETMPVQVAEQIKSFVNWFNSTQNKKGKG